MADTDVVLDFIERRFKECNWLNGNCYWFAYILTKRFPFLEIYYNQVEGHFYAVDIVNLWAYDFTGVHEYDVDNMRCFECLKGEDPELYGRLIRDCVN